MLSAPRPRRFPASSQAGRLKKSSPYGIRAIAHALRLPTSTSSRLPDSAYDAVISSASMTPIGQMAASIVAEGRAFAVRDRQARQARWGRSFVARPASAGLRYEAIAVTAGLRLPVVRTSATAPWTIPGHSRRTQRALAVRTWVVMTWWRPGRRRSTRRHRYKVGETRGSCFPGRGDTTAFLTTRSTWSRSAQNVVDQFLPPTTWETGCSTRTTHHDRPASRPDWLTEIRKQNDAACAARRSQFASVTRSTTSDRRQKEPFIEEYMTDARTTCSSAGHDRDARGGSCVACAKQGHKVVRPG